MREIERKYNYENMLFTKLFTPNVVLGDDNYVYKYCQKSNNNDYNGREILPDSKFFIDKSLMTVSEVSDEEFNDLVEFINFNLREYPFYKLKRIKVEDYNENINGKILNIKDNIMTVEIYYRDIFRIKMPYIRGITLKEYIKNQRDMSLLNDLLLELLEEMKMINEKYKVVHNDIHEGNIIYDEDERKLTVIDYEFACLRDEDNCNRDIRNIKSILEM